MSEATADLRLSDCISGMASRRPGSVHLLVTSIPFEELFTYSGKLEDCGNNGSTVDIEAGRFALNMRFFAEQVVRVMAPGCNACIHIQQLLAYKNQHGYMGRRDFRGAMYNVFRAAGLMPAGEFVIPKCPQIMAQRLSLHSLQFKTGRERDANLWAPAVNDYVLIFHKEGENPTPVKALFDKRQNPAGWLTGDEWVRDAHGVWSDINELDVLQGARDPKHKEAKSEKHVCPLQLEVIRRCIRLYSNPVSIQPDVTVMDPFCGIGSSAFVALGGVSPVTGLSLEEPRNFVGFELKESYHRASLGYAEEAIKQWRARSAKGEAVPERTLFDALPSCDTTGKARSGSTARSPRPKKRTSGKT